MQEYKNRNGIGGWIEEEEEEEEEEEPMETHWDKGTQTEDRSRPGPEFRVVPTHLLCLLYPIV
jgi:hypothetical protein